MYRIKVETEAPVGTKKWYLGEYGAISNADDDSAVRWYNDVADLCLEYGIGRAVWSYRGFSRITDEHNEVHDIRMVKAIARK